MIPIYAIPDDIFQYIITHETCMITSVDYFIMQKYKIGNRNVIRTSIAELQNIGLVHANGAWNNVSPTPLGKDVHNKYGSYSKYIEVLDGEKQLSKQLILEQIMSFEKDNWYKRWDFRIAAFSLLISVIAIFLQCNKSG